MFKRKLIACLLTLSLIASALGGPAMANTVESSPQTASALSDNLATASEDQGLSLGLDASFSEVVTDSQEHQGGTSEQPAGLPADTISEESAPAPADSIQGEGEATSANGGGATYSAQPVGEPEPISNPTASSSTAGSLYVPGPLIGMRPAPSAPCTTDGVILDISSKVDVLVANQATAKTGTGTAAGSNVDNSTSGTSKAVALNDSGQEVAPSTTGAFADNSVVRAIANTGTATAATGLAEANNTSQENTATVAPKTAVAVDVLGEIVDSTVIVKILYKYWAGIMGLADATTGNGGASGLTASNSINSDDKAVAKGDAATVNGGGSYDGSALALNESDNVIGNDGSAFAASGKANADNTMLGNDIYIAPTINTLIQFCGDIIRSNVTVELLYNFMATIAGQAVAQSGDSKAIGADVVNKIGNFTSSKAIGDAPTVAGAGGYSDGSAMAVNDTKNSIDNIGEAAAISGQAEALNSMLNNDIFIAPAITSALNLLESIVDSNVVIKITYNIWATITGEAQAQTGDVSGAGVDADNSINNASSATAIGDSAKLSLFGGGSGSANGEAVALNSTANQIDNDGAALSLSGDAKAANTMLDNIVNLSPVIDTIVMVVREIRNEDSVVIEIVYDIWATLTGSANAASGSATSYGAFGANVIDSSSDAYAVAKVTLTKPDGSATALNTSDNVIVNDGLGLASSGKADASSSISNAEVSLTGYLAERCYIGNDYNGPIAVAIGAAVKECADAISGDAMAFGSKADSAMKSNAVSKDIFGSGGFSINDSDADIYNIGQGIAMTSSALAVSGKAAPNNTQNKIVIGFGPLNGQPAARAGSTEPISGSASPAASSVSANDGPASVNGENNTGSGSAAGEEPASSAAAGGDTPSLNTYEAADGSWLFGAGSPAWTADIAPYASAVKSYIDTKLFGDISPIFSDAVALPWWLWVIFAGLLATSIRLGLRLKPKRR
ncbi:MAG: hypothetical protein Q8J63_02690 [Candidatus Aquicultor sp.]|nr:hypothetical protein [Candidatus Aquicultor sp.]